MAAYQNVSLRHANAANLIKSAHLPAAAMPKIVVTRHHESSSVIMDQIVLVTLISQYYSNNLVGYTIYDQLIRPYYENYA